jgi:predicted Zn-dependent protease with MMP-like domain/Flp pilus assembly protein TadD
MMKKHEEAVADAVSAHLDRGWDLLKKNDPAGARISAEAALGIDGESPDALTLLGACAAAVGDEDEALDLYRKASAADPDYVSPLLYQAEILILSREEIEEGLALVDQALELSEDEDEYLDALLLKAEALIAKGAKGEGGNGANDQAARLLDELPPVQFPGPDMHLRAARCFLDLQRDDEAEDHFRKALELHPGLADAYHGLGLVYEAREDHRAMVKAWLRVRELDLEEKALPWAVLPEEFEHIAEEALAELPERIRKLLENVPIVASDYPAIEIVAEGNDPRMMGFFSGVPYPEKSNISDQAPHLDCVFLYQRNIERMSRDRDEVAREIRITLLHETGHFFGLSEEELEEMGLG